MVWDRCSKFPIRWQKGKSEAKLVREALALASIDKGDQMKKIFSFDAETNGLWGEAFAIGALVYDENGAEIERFVGRLSESVVTDGWWNSPEDGETETRLQKLARAIPVTYEDYNSLLADFAKFYLANKADADVVVHMGYIVEAKVLRDMHDRGLIGEWDGPYPLHDVSGNLQQAGEDPTSVDKYVQKCGLSVGAFQGGTHNPLYDSAVAAVVYRHLLIRQDNPEYPKHTHASCLTCGKEHYVCFLEVCYQIEMVGKKRDCAECEEYYRWADSF